MSTPPDPSSKDPSHFEKQGLPSISKSASAGSDDEKDRYPHSPIPSADPSPAPKPRIAHRRVRAASVADAAKKQVENPAQSSPPQTTPQKRGHRSFSESSPAAGNEPNNKPAHTKSKTPDPFDDNSEMGKKELRPLLPNHQLPSPVVDLADAERLMHLALDQAKLALDVDEIPIGCVIRHDPTGRIIAASHNRRHVDHDPTAHAEILAIRQAAEIIGDWRLIDCTLVVTLEPCPMCAGAIVNARIPRLIYGCTDPKAGAVDTLYSITADKRLNHQIHTLPCILAPECAQMLTDFFKKQRARGKK